MGTCKVFPSSGHVIVRLLATVLLFSAFFALNSRVTWAVPTATPTPTDPPTSTPTPPPTLTSTPTPLPTPTTPPPQNPNTVYVYNSAGDGFDHNCQGHVWSQMGFLGANGEPATEGGQNNNDMMLGGNDVGDVIGRNAQGQANAYRSQNAAREAYDLSRGATLAQAYGRLDDADQLVICKHGSMHTHNEITHNGGNIELDGGTDYTGFGPQAGGGGTNIGADFGDPYPLPAPLGAITATLYSCWSGNDPDGAGNGEISVDASLEAILGAGRVTSFAGGVRAPLTWGVTGGNPQQRQAAVDALRTAAENAGYRTGDATEKVGKWLTDQPFTQQRSTGQNAIDNAGVQGVNLQLSYPAPRSESLSMIPPPISSGSECLHACSGGGCYVQFESAWLVVPPGSLPGVVVFDLHQLDATMLPPGPGGLDSMVLDLGAVGGLLAPGRLTLPYFIAGSSPDIYRLDAGAWLKIVAGRVDDTGMQTISVNIEDLGIFAAFTAVAVGGAGELPPLAPASAEEARAPAGRSGWSAGSYAALAAGLAAAGIAIAGGGWYAMRRRLR